MRVKQRLREQPLFMIVRGVRHVLLSEKFNEPTLLTWMRHSSGLAGSCPLLLKRHPARKFVAQKIVECASLHSQTLGGLTGAG